MLSKVAIIADTHYGCRGDISALHKNCNKFFKDVFFPEIDKRGIRHIIHLGDLVDRRKYINFETAYELDTNFIAPMMRRNITMDIMVGNHDIFYKNTNVLNAIDTLYHSNEYINIISDPTEIEIYDTKILYIPWINKENQKVTLEYLKNTKAMIGMGHLELSGFQMYKGSVCNEGMDSKLFNNLDMVLSGHFHHKSSIGNVHYLGAPYQMYWSDYDDPRGFHILDLHTREMEYIENPHKLFHKIEYDDTIDFDYDFKQYKDSYIKVFVKNETDSIKFDDFIDKLENMDVIDLQIIRDNKVVINDNEEEYTDIEIQDTKQIMNSFVDSMQTKTEKEDIKQFLSKLYDEAIGMQLQ